jgi:hypothetical protein
MFAYVYPLLGVFWSMLIFFLWIAWFMLLFRIIADIFRSADLGGFAKAMWFIFVIFLPFLGVLVYCIARGGSMAERSYAAKQVHNRPRCVRASDGGSGRAGRRDRQVRALLDQGVITDAEFAAEGTATG